MNKNKKHKETDVLRKKILAGLSLSFIRLLEKKQRNDGEFVFSRDGEIIRLKAREYEHQLLMENINKLLK